MTTLEVDAPLVRVPIAADELSGISQDSYVMVDKLTTVRRAKLGQRTGRVTANQMVTVERALLVFLGLAG
jgi:mRNA interferase MazF